METWGASTVGVAGWEGSGSDGGAPSGAGSCMCMLAGRCGRPNGGGAYECAVCISMAVYYLGLVSVRRYGAVPFLINCVYCTDDRDPLAS